MAFEGCLGIKQVKTFYITKFYKEIYTIVVCIYKVLKSKLIINNNLILLGELKHLSNQRKKN